MALTLSTAQTELDAWLAADLAVSQGRVVTIGDRTISQEHANIIREQIDYWQTKVAQLKAGESAGSDDYARHSPGIRVARWTR